MENSSDNFSRVTFDKIKLSYFECNLFFPYGGLPYSGSRGGARGGRGPAFRGKKRINHREKRSRQGKLNNPLPHP